MSSSTISNLHNFGLAWCCCVSVSLILWWLYHFSIKRLHSFLLSFHNSLNLRFRFCLFFPCSSYQKLLHKPELGSSWSHPSDDVTHGAAHEGWRFPSVPKLQVRVCGCLATANGIPALVFHCWKGSIALLQMFLPDIISLLFLRKQQWLFNNANEDHQHNDSSLSIWKITCVRFFFTVIMKVLIDLNNTK